MGKRIGIVEKVVDKCIVELHKRNEYHVARNGNWACISDAYGMTLCHYGTQIACCARDGKFHCTITSASDRDGVNTFSTIVLGRDAVHFKDFVPVPYNEKDEAIVVHKTVNDLEVAIRDAFSAAQKNARVIGVRA